MPAPASARVPLATWLAVAGFSAFWIMLGAMVAPSALHHDFLNLYNGASMARDGAFSQMHDPAFQFARQQSIDAPVPTLVPFVRLHWYATVLAPLSFFPQPVAFGLWIGVQTASLIALWIWCRRQWGGDALILCSLFLPAALGIAHGQDSVWIAWIVAGIYGFSRDRNSMAAGFLLGLGFLKFHLFLLWPLALLLDKRWRTIAGAAISVALQMLYSLIVAGWSGFLLYPALLLRKDIERLSPSPELMTNIQGLTANAHAGLWFRAIMTLIVILLVAAACWRAPHWRWTSAAAVGSILAAPHVYGYDASLLLVPLIACSFEQDVPKFVRVCAVALLAPLAFFAPLGGEPWAAITPLILLLFLVSLASSAWGSLPIYDLRSKQLEPLS
jgi:hypothetical protein